MVDFIKHVESNIADLKLDQKTKQDIISSIQSKTKLTTSSMSSSAMNAIKDGSLMLGRFLSPTVSTNTDNDEYSETNVEFLWYPRSSRSGKIKNKKNTYGQFVVVVNPTRYSHYLNKIRDIMAGVEDGIADIVQGCKGRYCEKGEVGPSYFQKRIYTNRREKPTEQDNDGYERDDDSSVDSSQASTNTSSRASTNTSRRSSNSSSI
jgi:hypothetical protein